MTHRENKGLIQVSQWTSNGASLETSSLTASSEACGPGYPGVAGFKNCLPHLPAKLTFQFLFGSVPTQELPGFRDHVFLHNRFGKIHQGRNNLQRWVRAQERWRISLGAYDGDGTVDGTSCLQLWRQLQRSGGSSGLQPSLTAESPLMPQREEA